MTNGPHYLYRALSGEGLYRVEICPYAQAWSLDSAPICEYKTEAEREVLYGEMIGKLFITGHIPQCPSDALKDKNGRTVCMMASVEWVPVFMSDFLDFTLVSSNSFHSEKEARSAQVNLEKQFPRHIFSIEYVGPSLYAVRGKLINDVEQGVTEALYRRFTEYFPGVANQIKAYEKIRPRTLGILFNDDTQVIFTYTDERDWIVTRNNEKITYRSCNNDNCY